MIDDNVGVTASNRGHDEKSEEVSLNFSPPKDPTFAPNSSTAEELAEIASYVTGEMTRVFVRLQEILDGFKETVEAGGYAGDQEIGQSLGGILIAVEEVRTQMEQISSYAIAMSSAKLAHATKGLRQDLRSLLGSNRSS